MPFFKAWVVKADNALGDASIFSLNSTINHAHSCAAHSSQCTVSFSAWHWQSCFSPCDWPDIFGSNVVAGVDFLVDLHTPGVVAVHLHQHLRPHLHRCPRLLWFVVPVLVVRIDVVAPVGSNLLLDLPVHSRLGPHILLRCLHPNLLHRFLELSWLCAHLLHV